MSTPTPAARRTPDTLGPALIVAFALSQAIRDVYFAGVFQGESIQLVILASFIMATVVFGTWTIWRHRAQVHLLRRQIPLLLAMNVATALAWNCYFFALRHLEPALVNTLHGGLGPLTVIALAAAGVGLAGKSKLTPLEATFHAGGAITLLTLGALALTGRSGLATGSLPMQLAALAAILVSGSSITISLLLAKRLHDLGCGAELVTAARYLLIMIVAASVLALAPPAQLPTDPTRLAWLGIAGFALIVLPLYVLQLGIARTQPLTAHVIRSLGPVFVFALEQVDGRITFAPPVLALIVVYSICAIGASLSRR